MCCSNSVMRTLLKRNLTDENDIFKRIDDQEVLQLFKNELKT